MSPTVISVKVCRERAIYFSKRLRGNGRLHTFSSISRGEGQGMSAKQTMTLQSAGRPVWGVGWGWGVYSTPYFTYTVRRSSKQIILLMFACKLLAQVNKWIREEGRMKGRKEGRNKGNVLFNDALNTFYLRLYGA